MGADTYKLLKNLLHPNKPNERTFSEICKILKGRVLPLMCVTLKNLSYVCEFGAFLPEALRDRLVCVMKHVPIQTKFSRSVI